MTKTSGDNGQVTSKQWRKRQGTMDNRPSNLGQGTIWTIDNQIYLFGPVISDQNIRGQWTVDTLKLGLIVCFLQGYLLHINYHYAWGQWTIDTLKLGWLLVSFWATSHQLPKHQGTMDNRQWDLPFLFRSSKQWRNVRGQWTIEFCSLACSRQTMTNYVELTLRIAELIKVKVDCWIISNDEVVWI